ncbi:exo-beta-1,3-glucanase [Mycena belliarum]|uniref:Exo-beta-1,3-glucanase n=1 Tax=Mycena belliarum TaxID=1033014 RepID=A0AAD6TX26_9AGAR|nr:exo-beta-1,3-glucanase [Mycena belliae]
MRTTFSHSLAVLALFLGSARSACTPISPAASASDPFWLNNGGLSVQGKSAYRQGFKVFRNVKTDYNAVGDGIADDTAAINNAISDGGTCGKGCHSSTISPAVIFFPPGKYRVTKPIILYYFTSLVGDTKNKPTLVGDANFGGVAIIDADPYLEGVSNPDGSGINWWQNQNNFFRSVRNFVIDTTAMSPAVSGTGIHWQVGQATSIINVDFKLSTAAGTKHQGIYMENGSGGFMSDLTIDGGAFGLWLSNQQFTIRNVKISNAGTGIYQLWNWGFTWQNVQISNCQVGFDLNTGGIGASQTAAGILIVDSSISNTKIGIRTSSSQPTSLGGSLVLDNVAFSGITTANVQDASGTLVPANAAGNAQWFQGNVYKGTSKRYLRGSYTPAGSRPASLVDGSGKFFTKSRPQYGNFKDSQFKTLMTSGLGAAGNGVADDTNAINTFIQQNSGCAILVIEAGTYKVTDTIVVPVGTTLVGGMFSTILGSGAKFADQANPRPVIKVGNAGDRGAVEISDLVIATTGGSAGAIGIEWNVNESSQGAAGMWDVHIRLGGAQGTNINSANCPKGSTDVSKCASAFLGFHITPTGSGYFENVWVWNADHDLDDPAESQINVFSGRGVLVESTNGPVWLVGTASEHHVIYQYSIKNAKNVYAGLIQTETPYFQPTPAPPAPFSLNAAYGDPASIRNDAYGLVIASSSNVFVYGAGLYNFFQSYNQDCVPNRNCQESMALVDQASTSVYLYQLTTAGSTSMLRYPNATIAQQADNINGFASTVSLWESA